MSAFGGKADIFHCPAKSPLIAKSGRSDRGVSPATWRRQGCVPEQGLEDGGLIGAAGVFNASPEGTGVRKIIDITHAAPRGGFESGNAVVVLKHQGTANTGFRYTSFA